MLHRLEDAADHDMAQYKKGKPGTKKLQVLPWALKQLQRTNMQARA